VVNVNTMGGREVRVMVFSATFNNILDLQLPVQSVPITTKVVSSNPAYGMVYSLQLYVIKFCSDLRHVGDFLRILRFPPPKKVTATI
jgi:hypothetical protein